MSKQARLRTQEMRKAQQEAARREARRKRVVLVVGGLLVLGLVVAIGFAVARAMQSDDAPGGAGASGEVVVPANTDDGAIPVGEGDAPEVTIYFDYMCPACGQLEAANGDELDRLLDAGDVRLALRPISFLDETSEGTDYSTRTANAVATVADGSPEDVWDFHRALYEDQPAEGTPGRSDEEIAQVALDAGVPDEVVDRFADGTHEGWVAQVTQDAFDSGVEGTPTVLIDGEEFEGDVYSPGALTQAIEAAAGNQEQ